MLDGQVPAAMGITFFVPGKPEPGGSKRWLPLKGRLGGRPLIVDANPKVGGWKERVAYFALQEARRRDWEPIDSPCVLTLAFVLERPSGHYGTKGVRPSAPAWPGVKPDLTKLTRSTEDAIKGILYTDDSRVIEQRITKRYGTEPGVHVTLSPI